MMKVEFLIQVGDYLGSTQGAADFWVDQLTLDTALDVGACACLQIRPALQLEPGEFVQVWYREDPQEQPLSLFAGVLRMRCHHNGASLIECDDNFGLLRAARTSAAYQDVKAGFVLQDQLSQYEITPGGIDEGPLLGSFHLHLEVTVAEHLRRLSRHCGAYFYGDGEGRICWRMEPTQVELPPERLIEAALFKSQVDYDGVTFTGQGDGDADGPALTRLPLQTTSPRNSVWARPIGWGAIRSGPAASMLARQRASQYPVNGWVLLAGEAQLGPGQVLRTEQGLGRVRSVQHRFHSAQGFTTRVRFS